MPSRRVFILGPGNKPLWVRLYVHQIGETWATMIVADEALPPGPGELKGMAFFGDTRHEAEERGRMYLGASEPVN
jgi:hypothetical protein